MINFEKITNWLTTKPESDKEGLIKLSILVGVLLFCVFPLIGIIFWCVYWMPWLFIGLVFSCLALSCISIVWGICYKEFRLKSWGFARYFLFPFGCFWVSSIAMLCICFILANCDFRMATSKVQFPVGHIKAIDINSKGQIYYMDSMYSRVQVFNRDGSFFKSWFLPIKGKYSGVVGFSLGENDDINLVYRDKTLIYDSLGHFKKAVEHRDIDIEEYESYTKKIVQDSSGISYQSTKELFSRWQLIKLDGKEKTVLISEPFGLWLVGGFFPSFLFIMMSVFFWTLLSYMHKHEKSIERL